MKIIGFCGLPGSGKSTAMDSIENLGTIINMGDIVRKEAEKRNIEVSGKNLGKLAIELRKKEGEGVIAHKCVNIIKNLDSEIIFVDGIRSLEELKIFRNYWKFPLVEITAEDNIRYKRISERERSDDSRKLDEIIERDKREINFGINKLLKKSDYVIHNNTTKDDLYRKMRETVKKIIEKY